MDAEKQLDWKQLMRKFLPEHYVIYKWSHRQRPIFFLFSVKEKEKHYSETNIVEVVRLPFRTKTSFYIQVLMNSSFKQQPK